MKCIKNAIIFGTIENIPLWNPEQSLKILNDSNGNPTPVIRLSNWKDYFDLIESRYIADYIDDLIFRGYKCSEWPLESSLTRINKGYPLQQSVVDFQLSNFKEQTSKYHIDNDIQLWTIGQHYGLWTPYLDWSHDPAIALYFAFVDSENAGKYRAVTILNRKKICEIETRCVFH